MLISLERAGKFRASQMIPNTHKCAAMRTKVYRYNVKIEATDARLTPEGFLLNNELVQSYFESKWGNKANEPWDAMSCEKMALTAATDFCKTLRSQNVECRRVWVTIFGSNGAAITAEWSSDMG